MAEETKDPQTPDEQAPLDETARLAAIAALTGGASPTAPEAPAPTVNVKRTGSEVDFGGRTTVVVLARHVNTTVKGQNVVARRGDIVTAPAEWVTRATALGAVAKVDA
ncbi:hypothetical protein ACSYDW_07100 [Paeniglutamicibacter sp. R2-26]|uniref:hypothetical protein n=1 Tax=Paeniglutamicibacter sp. R2-26 TaxID=3144417 RepID=UPI003EE6A65E